MRLPLQEEQTPRRLHEKATTKVCLQHVQAALANPLCSCRSMKFAAPAAERELFEKPLDFRKAVPQLSDKFTVHGASYARPPIQPIPIDRAFEKMDSFAWRGHLLACDWMPGQTEFACCVHGEIDGRRVAFTGDNIFGSPADPAQHGHEAVVARNACTVEEGYGYAARYLHGIAPDLILGGHSWVIENPGPLIERYVTASDELRAALADLTTEKDYRLWFDPYWARVHPYRLKMIVNVG